MVCLKIVLKQLDCRGWKLELFSEIGELVRYGIHFDKDGRPSGSAEVVFARRSDAFQALKRYNNVQLDGKPMKIEIIGANAETPLSARVNVVGGANGKKRTVVIAPGPGRSRGGFASANRGSAQRGRGGSSNVRGGVRGRGRGRGGAVEAVVVVVDVVELNGERKLWRNQLMNLIRSWRIIMLKQCNLDVRGAAS
ncbi:UNVERIFIED_CONTAM: THO complex subunitC [Sesamum radiatum]|uniref:THO complex subunitC n=1 Tax=Sesamum radiatum TaxID=300843 RepID=A0AAW2V2D5_SESRA